MGNHGTSCSFHGEIIKLFNESAVWMLVDFTSCLPILFQKINIMNLNGSYVEYKHFLIVLNHNVWFKTIPSDIYKKNFFFNEDPVIFFNVLL